VIKTRMIQRWVAAFGVVAMGCTTNVTDNAPLPLGSSTILGSAPATAALLVDSTTVTWVTADGAIESCTKGDCQPRSIATNYGSLGASFNWADSSAVVSQGEIYFIASNTPTSNALQSCPLSGCSTPAVLGTAAGPRVVTDGNWLAYYAADMKGLSICSLPGCSSPTVVQPATATIGINGFALANGVLSFLSQSVVTGPANLYSLEYCQVDACASGLQTAWQETLPSGDQAPFAAVVGANQSSVFVTTSADGELMRCDLPTCASPVDMGAEVNAGSMGIFSGTDIFMGSVSFASNTPASWMHCSLEQCDPSPIPYPDPVLAGLCPPVTGGPPQFGTLPFAVDAANFYWATGSIYKSTGNLIVSTAR
jgi:hypothetical protein